MLDRRGFLSYGLAAMAVPIGERVLGAAAWRWLPLTTEGWQAVPARMADEICDSYLINTRYYAATVYGYTDAVVGLVQDLGRERFASGSPPAPRPARRCSRTP